jgi:hypothetical protein
LRFGDRTHGNERNRGHDTSSVGPDELRARRFYGKDLYEYLRQILKRIVTESQKLGLIDAAPDGWMDPGDVSAAARRGPSRPSKP